MLFTEAAPWTSYEYMAALRVVESLSEHALCEPLTWPVMFKSDSEPGARHSPEFISMMFHSMRWAESLSDDNVAWPCILQLSERGI